MTGGTIEAPTSLATINVPASGTAWLLALLSHETRGTVALSRDTIAGGVSLTLALLQAALTPATLLTALVTERTLAAWRTSTLSCHWITRSTITLAGLDTPWPKLASVTPCLTLGPCESRWTVVYTGASGTVTGDSVVTLAHFLAPGAPPTIWALLGAVSAHVPRTALTPASLWMTLQCGVGLALALVAAVGSIGEIRAGQVAEVSDAARVALTETKDSVAAIVWTGQLAAAITLASVFTCRTPVLTVFPKYTRWTGTRPVDGITCSSILALAHLLASCSVESFLALLLALWAPGTRRTHASFLCALAGALSALYCAPWPCVSCRTPLYQRCDVGGVFSDCEQVVVKVLFLRRRHIFLRR